MSTLHFAQISDIHISTYGDHHDMLSGQATKFLTQVVTNLNQIEDLDFVLITGDLFDTALPQEVEQFQIAIKHLEKPYYVIPGNHDRRDSDKDEGLTRHQFAQLFNPQVQARPATPEAQAGYWSVAINAHVQLIGLDSIIDEDWGGLIDPPQLSWLAHQLANHADKFVILAVHHPLHNLAPIDEHEQWHKFVCDNGAEVMTLLDQHPQVKMVLTGHHHLTKLNRFDNRLHLACPSLVIYPCAYRTLRLSLQPDNQWHIEWQTHPATTESTIATAKQTMVTVWSQTEFEPDFVKTHVNLANGREEDRHGQAILAG